MKSYEIAADIKPTERQLKWQDTEFYAIIYYGMNTFTGRELSDGFTVPEMFCPENLNTDEWAELVRDSGMKGMILTAKHYDGFCTWQTEATDYSVKSSNWLEGKGDLVKMAAESARKFGLKFGVYLPIWDRHEKSFKSSDGSYNKFFLTQVRELLTGYGSLFTLWLDDRCDDEMSFSLDYKAVYAAARELQPDCAVVFRGPDGRWVGNNRGVTRKAEWSCVPASFSYAEDGSVPHSKKQPRAGQMDIDIGSRSAIKGEESFLWAPCEVNYPMRSHWFYKKDDDYSAKTKDKLLDIYYRTVGGNANLMLGIAPDKAGKFHETDIQILKATGHDLKVIFGYNLLKDSKITASSSLSRLYPPENTAEDSDTFWSPGEKDKKPELIISFNKSEMFDKVIIKEHICNGQHAEDFTVYIDAKGKWKKFAQGECIGHKKICTGRPVETTRIKIVFEKYRKLIEISHIQVN